MSPSAVILVLISASIHVGWNYLTKSSKSPRSFTVLKGLSAVTLFMMLAPFMPFASISPRVWLYVLLSGVVHAVYFFALTSAYETGDISFVYPIARSAPAFVPIAAFLILGERLSLRGGFGIALVVICILILQLRGTGLKKFASSFGQKDSIWAFITLGAVVSYTLIDKAAMVAFSREGAIGAGLHGPIYYILQITLCYILFSLCSLHSIHEHFKTVCKQEWRQALAAEIGTLISYSLILHVMQTETVSYIVTLRQSSVLFAVLVGWLVLKEAYGRFRVLVAAVMVGGFYLVATAHG